MSREFDFYEYAAVIVPGAVLLLGALWLSPEAEDVLGPEGVTFGELGLFVIIAYAVGQLVQGVGNWLQALFWKPLGGLPNRKLLAGGLLNPPQHRRLMQRLEHDGILAGDPSALSEDEVRAVVREVYARVAAGGRASRINTFNGMYGLLRGLAAALLLIFGGALAVGVAAQSLVALAAAFALALQRMHRFGVHYTRELFIVYLSMDATS